MALGRCAFCEREANLVESHVLPAFVYRWLRSRSATGHIRHSDAPNRRIQDGLKLPWLCGECEGLFSRFETTFASKIFYPWLNGDRSIRYDHTLLRFCVSISWRVLTYAMSHGRGGDYSSAQRQLLKLSAQRWKDFLTGRAPHPGEFEQHLIIMDVVEETSIPNLPKNFNRYMLGAVTFDIVGSSNSLMTFAKLGRFIIFGFIQERPRRWSGTKIRLQKGYLRPGKVVLPSGLLHLFREKADFASQAYENMSEKQRAKIEATVERNFDAFLASEQFEAIAADARMFGSSAVIHDDD